LQSCLSCVPSLLRSRPSRGTARARGLPARCSTVGPGGGGSGHLRGCLHLGPQHACLRRGFSRSRPAVPCCGFSANLWFRTCTPWPQPALRPSRPSRNVSRATPRGPCRHLQRSSDQATRQSWTCPWPRVGARTAQPSHEFFLPAFVTFSSRIALFRYNQFSTLFKKSLFLNEGGRIKKNHLSKLHYQFQRYTSLIKSVQLELQCLQSYDGFPDFYRPIFEELHHNSIGIVIQAEHSCRY
jgi:hypothetical protein